LTEGNGGSRCSAGRQGRAEILVSRIHEDIARHLHLTGRRGHQGGVYDSVTSRQDHGTSGILGGGGVLVVVNVFIRDLNFFVDESGCRGGRGTHSDHARQGSKDAHRRTTRR
jgi:hypothetical protein